MNRQRQTEQPRLIIVMGVSGCGKSTLAQALAESLQCQYLEADDFHLPEAVEMMAAGIPLTEAQRSPWIDSLLAELDIYSKSGQSVVMAYSGLKREHRQRFRQLPFYVRFVWLDGSESFIAQRLQQRSEHFFAPELLASQFAAMESPREEGDILHLKLDSQPSLARLIQISLEYVNG